MNVVVEILLNMFITVKNVPVTYIYILFSYNNVTLSN